MSIFSDYERGLQMMYDKVINARRLYKSMLREYDGNLAQMYVDTTNHFFSIVLDQRMETGEVSETVELETMRITLNIIREAILQQYIRDNGFPGWSSPMFDDWELLN